MQGQRADPTSQDAADQGGVGISRGSLEGETDRSPRLLWVPSTHSCTHAHRSFLNRTDWTQHPDACFPVNTNALAGCSWVLPPPSDAVTLATQNQPGREKGCCCWAPLRAASCLASLYWGRGCLGSRGDPCGRSSGCTCLVACGCGPPAFHPLPATWAGAWAGGTVQSGFVGFAHSAPLT